MDRCANTEYYNAKMNADEKVEIALESFYNYIEDDLEIIREAIDRIKSAAKDYCENDFTEDAEEIIREIK